MSDIIKIDNHDVTVVEWGGERVLSTRQVAELYNTDRGRIKNNYLRNADRFVEGVHFYKLEGADLQDFREMVSERAQVPLGINSFMLWTKRGVARHCKMLRTDRAWDIFDLLEENYFTAPAPHVPQTPLEILQAQSRMIAKQTDIMMEHEQEIGRLKLRAEEQDKQMALISDRLDTFNGVGTDEDKRQKLNSMIRLYAIRWGLQFQRAWSFFRKFYNTAFHTNIKLACKWFMKQNGIKKPLTLPEYLVRSGRIDDALMVADKMLSMSAPPEQGMALTGGAA